MEALRELLGNLKRDMTFLGIEDDLLNEAVEELELLDNNLKDLFASLELTENETAEKRLNSMQTYLDRLKRDLK